MVSDVMGNTSRGAKTRVYTKGEKIYNYYGVIRGAAETNCSHIFIMESGFHDNIEDEAFLKLDDNLKKIAEAQVEVICEVLGVKEMTVQEAEKMLQEKAGLDDNTMQYLRFYRYGESLIIKLADAINKV